MTKFTFPIVGNNMHQEVNISIKKEDYEKLLKRIEHLEKENLNCKMVYGWAVGESRNTALALQAWERAKATFRQYNIPYKEMILHHDQDSVFTSYEWSGQLLLVEGLRLSYALQGAKDNPEMESFNSRFKSEGHSLFLCSQDLDELEALVNCQMQYDNTERRHSGLGYLSPLAYINRMRSLMNNP